MLFLWILIGLAVLATALVYLEFNDGGIPHYSLLACILGYSTIIFLWPYFAAILLGLYWKDRKKDVLQK